MDSSEIAARPDVGALPSASAARAPSTSPPSLLVRAAGLLAVALLRILGALPSPLVQALLTPALLPYRWLRRGHARRLQNCFEASPFAGRLSLGAYYRIRLGLLLRGLRVHGRPVTAAFPFVEVEGAEHYESALASGRPVVLLGLHAGPWELLHRVPPAPAGRPFVIVTAPAFSPALSAFMAGGRQMEGKRIAWIGGQGNGSLESGLRSVLNSKGVLALMADQHPGTAETCEYLHLWGRLRSPYPARMLRLLEAKGCVIAPISVRLAGVKAVFRFHGLWDTADPGKVRAFLESAINDSPDQWNWSYPKVVPFAFASAPDGEEG